MSRRVLLFPALLLESVQLKFIAAERAEHIIAAASNAEEPGLRLFDHTTLLPHVHDPMFGEALTRLLRAEAITHIYCPHDRCYQILRQLLPSDNPLGVTLSNGFTQFVPDLVHDALRASIAPIHDRFAARQWRRPIVPLDDLTAMLLTVSRIGGQSHAGKLATIGCIAADVPVGDWVEIGVAGGRSAAFLALLQQFLGCGKLVAVDPWINDEMLQNINELDDKLPGDNIAWERNARVAALNLLPYSRNNIAVLRLTSADAYQSYLQNRVFPSSSFGAVPTTGRIGLLHIDGNHDLPKVVQDLALWGGHLLPGGWMVVDDYMWDYGTGPQQAADAWLQDNRARVAEDFVAERALFVKIKEQAS